MPQVRNTETIATSPARPDRPSPRRSDTVAGALDSVAAAGFSASSLTLARSISGSRRWAKARLMRLSRFPESESSGWESRSRTTATMKNPSPELAASAMSRFWIAR